MKHWPPSREPVVWAWIFGAVLPSLTASVLNLPFWIHGPGAGPFRATPPLAWTGGLPLLGVALLTRRAGAFHALVWLQLTIGLVLMVTLLEAPRAILGVGTAGGALENTSYLDVAASYGLAFVAGVISTGLGAYLIRRKLSIDLAVPERPSSGARRIGS